ncbi:hypothetical protein CAEBREN_03505 [Caenorhabditis brenneri]|uniref:Uncharacterized protein n=1 Tax=Caenorhabditis brenneri TaxID=135651 RepID=G0MZ60_CAEBE|nr:hypothetical protein CAEBREN_03505 [Caenorhabditis brenneri]
MPANSALPFRTSRMESNEDQEKEDIREEIRQVKYNIALLEYEMNKAEDREKSDVRNHRKELALIQKSIKKYEKLTKKCQDRCKLLRNKQRKLWETCWKKWIPQQKESAKQIQKERKKAQEYRKKISNPSRTNQTTPGSKRRIHQAVETVQSLRKRVHSTNQTLSSCSRYLVSLNSVLKLNIIPGCGHTICYSYCFKMSTPFGIECPFDRISTPTPKTMLSTMPMNLTLLHM